MEKNIRNNLYLALVHYPVYNKKHEIVTTSLTPIDLHDLARLARTYGVERFFIIIPLDGQRALANRIVGYWTHGFGLSYNPSRMEALSHVGVYETLGGARQWLHDKCGRPPLMVATSAREHPKAVNYPDMRKEMLQNPTQPYLLLFGTGWGLTDELIDNCSFVLQPIKTLNESYNHLSIRSASAIVLDRLCGNGF